MPIRYVLFDHDGTLLSTLEVRAQSLEHAMHDVMNRAVNGKEVFARAHGQSLSELGEWLTDGDAAKTEALIDAYRAHYYQANQVGFEPYEGIAHTLDVLRGKAIKMAVVTSKLRRGAHDELIACGLRKYFEFMVGAEDVERHKPNPEPLDKAIQAIGANREQTLMIGDTTADVLGAKAAKVRSAAALWDAQDPDEMRAAAPDHLLDDPRELIDLVG